jgi:hypothetical protein
LPKSPYYNWSWKKRDSFFYDLALAIGQNAVPVCGDYALGKHKELGLDSEPFEHLFKAFFNDVGVGLAHHWPSLNGPNFKEKIHFVCDDNPNKRWTDTFREVHCQAKQMDERIGGISFENDEDPAHTGLQVADYLIALYRQNAFEKSETGQHQKPRIIDLIVYRNLDHPGSHGINASFMPQPIFEVMIEAFRKDEQAQKQRWKARGNKGQKYYPLEHVQSVVKTAAMITPNKRGEFLKWARENGDPFAIPANRVSGDLVEVIKSRKPTII